MSKFCKLKDISSQIASGITPSRTNSKYWENGTIPWLKTEQLNEYEIYETSEHITQFALEETSIKIFPVNTLSIAMYGEGRTRGNVAILKTPMTTNQACCNIVVDEKKAHYKFVYYFLKTQYFQLRSLSSGVRKNLNSNDIKEFEVRLPKNLSEQQQIASVLSALDAKIELNNRINAELEAMAKTLYDYWFVQFEFPYSPPTEGCPQDGVGIGKPYKSSGGKMVYNAELKREIPEGWEVKTISEWIKKDKSGDWGKETEEGNYQLKVSCVRGADLNGLNGNGELKPPTRFILENNSNKLLDNHDLIVEISGGSPTQSTGRLAFITEETLLRFQNPLICSNFCKALTLKEEKYLYNFVYQWNRLYDNGVLFGWEGKTSGIKNLLFESFVTKHKEVFPKSEIVEKFYDFVKPIQSQKQKNLLQNQQLSELRDWLLPMLMNGQVTIAEAEKAVYKEEEAMCVAAEPVRKYS